jgi:hypothetical protein
VIFLLGGVLELDDFVFYSELLALQISNMVDIWQGTAEFAIDFLLQGTVTSPEGLDTILQRHGSSYR